MFDEPRLFLFGLLADDPEALELVELALLIADHLPGERPERRSLQGYAWVHIGCGRPAWG